MNIEPGTRIDDADGGCNFVIISITTRDEKKVIARCHIRSQKDCHRITKDIEQHLMDMLRKNEERFFG